MTGKTLILSDTHLGRPRRATVGALRPLWQDVDELVINGDVAEVQIPWLRGAAVREVDKLADFTNRDGVKLTLISGNHDAYLTDQRCIELIDRKVLVMHGDALHPAVAPWTHAARKLKGLTDQAIDDLDPGEANDLDARLAIAQHVGHSEFLEEYVLNSRNESNLLRAVLKPWQVPKVLKYWRLEPDLAELFLDRYAPQARVLILGHSHHPAVTQRGERTIINTGSFTFPGRPWGAMIQGNTVSVYPIIKKHAMYRRAPEPVFQTELNG